ncbi:MAG: hypothetical protein HGA85_03185 [Nanoarchaeota archaeon]|nr:hypothetical protein [Nanoarchaeota archaeon]
MILAPSPWPARKAAYGKSGNGSLELVIFYSILLVFAFALIGTMVSPTGLVAGTSQADAIDINRGFNESSSISLSLKGNITSIRISGYFIGGGYGQIRLGDRVIVDVRDLGVAKNQLTVLVVENVSWEENNSELSSAEETEANIEEAAKEPALDNSTEILLPDEPIVNTSLESANWTAERLNLTGEPFPTEGNATKPRPIRQNIVRIQNISSQEQPEEKPAGNASLTGEMNETINVPMPEAEHVVFDYYCLDTCQLDESGDIVIDIVLEDASVHLTSLFYSYYIEEGKSENVTNITSETNIILANATLANTTGTNDTVISGAAFNTSLQASQAPEIVSVEHGIVIAGQPVEWRQAVNLSIGRKLGLSRDAFNVTSDAMLEVELEDRNVSLEEFNRIALHTKLQREKIGLERPVSSQSARKAFSRLLQLSQEIDHLQLDRTEVVDVPPSLVFSNSSGDIAFVSYLTDGPQVSEKEIGPGRKQVTVSSEYHFINVTAMADIEEAKKESIKLYWLQDTGRVLIDEVDYIDSDENGLVDRLEWVVPHLSNQTFEISIVVLNPITYLRDGETWVVAFNTTGIGNLTISSPNAGWAEFLADDPETFDEMRFIGLRCSEDNLENSIKLVSQNNDSYLFNELTESDSVDVSKILLENYECNTTGYLTNYMLKAGYATVLFEFANQNSTVSDIAIDPNNFLIAYRNFSDTENNTAYGNSSDALTVTTTSYGAFGTATNPTGTEGWGIYNFTALGYSNIATNDGTYANLSCNAAGCSNSELFGTFNFTKVPNPVYFNSLYVAMEILLWSLTFLTLIQSFIRRLPLPLTRTGISRTQMDLMFILA